MAKTESIITFQNLSDNVETFDSKEQFMRYYDQHKEAIDKMATRGINQKYKINGYKIGRKNKQLMFYPIKVDTTNVEETTEDNVIEEIQDLRDRIDSLGNIMNKVLKLLLEMRQDSQSQASYTSGAVDKYGRTLQSSYR